MGMFIIVIISGVVVVVIGVLFFLGLIVFNIVSMVMGDNLCWIIFWVVLCGGGLVVLCDIIGWLVSYLFEIFVSVILGVIGVFVFLLLIVRIKCYVG